jgi:hypothetical protein
LGKSRILPIHILSAIFSEIPREIAREYAGVSSRFGIPSRRILSAMRQFFSGWTTKDYLTAAIALYGALLSTYMAWAKRRENKVDVRVELKRVVEPDERDALGGRSTRPGPRTRAYLSIVVRNHGLRDVSLPKDCCSLEYREPWKIVQMPPSSGLPVTLRHGESIRLIANDEHHMPGMDIRAIIADQLVRKFYSPWMEFPLNLPKLPTVD